jgi:uncharacterized protein
MLAAWLRDFTATQPISHTPRGSRHRPPPCTAPLRRIRFDDKARLHFIAVADLSRTHQLSKLPETETFFIDGPAGRLQALLEMPRSQDAAGAAVVCHPHPEHGGTLGNKVVHTLARAFVAKGFAVLRFNFRGVGESEGTFDEGRGELADALAAVEEMKERYGGKSLWLAGFSFGAAVAIRAAAEVRADGLVSVAPAVSRVAGEGGLKPDCPWLIIQGDEDELVPVGDTIEWVNSLEPGPELQIFSDTGHFFHGKLVRLRHAVETFIEEHKKNRA